MNALQTYLSTLLGGYVGEKDLPELIRLDRLCPVLVRCGRCRFTCAAQDLEHLIACIEAGGDYIRDVSLPTGADERAARWQPDCPVTPLASLPQSFTAQRKGETR